MSNNNENATVTKSKKNRELNKALAIGDEYTQPDRDLVRKMERVYGVHPSTNMQIINFSASHIFPAKRKGSHLYISLDSFVLYTRLSTIVFFTFFAIAYIFQHTLHHELLFSKNRTKEESISNDCLAAMSILGNTVVGPCVWRIHRGSQSKTRDKV